MLFVDNVCTRELIYLECDMHVCGQSHLFNFLVYIQCRCAGKLNMGLIIKLTCIE